MAQDQFGNYVVDITGNTTYVDPTNAGGAGVAGGGGGSAPDGAGFAIEGHGAPSGAPSTINADYDDDRTWFYVDLDTGITYPWSAEDQAWIGA